MRDPVYQNRRGLLWVLLVAAAALQPGSAMADAWEGLAEAAARSEQVNTAFRDPLAQFYADRQGRPLWFNSVQPSAKVDELLAVLADAASEGLDADDYRPDVLLETCGQGAPQDPVGCELQLTDSLLRYARDVAYGSLLPIAVDPDWRIPPRQMPVGQLLEQVAAATTLGPLLSELPPPHAAYARLRETLAAYRHEADRAPLPMVSAGPLLRAGDRGRRVRMLRVRLAVERPDLLDDVVSCLFDAELLAAVEAFQERHGLSRDGVVGPRTLAALNVPLAARIAELRVNMERWRWLPRELGERHIFVNLPGFELTLVRPDREPLRMRVIGGRPKRSTPSMQSTVSQLVLNPQWTVPRRIAVEDLLPQLQQDPLALQEKAISVLIREGEAWSDVDPQTVDWSQYHEDNFPYLLRQAPGPGNSLGRIKFNMYNPYQIYLHDTPSRGLFRKPQRAFSSGCIRVEQPLRLAAHLFDGDADQVGAWLWRRIDRGDTDFLRVSPRVPVYLVYLTAWVDDTGTVQFRDDIYRRNSQLRHKFTTRIKG